MTARDDLIEELAELYRRDRIAHTDSEDEDIEGGLNADIQAASCMADALTDEALHEAAEEVRAFRDRRPFDSYVRAALTIAADLIDPEASK